MKKRYLEKNKILTWEIEWQRTYFSSNNEATFHHETKALNDIADKCKSHKDERGLGYINKIETSTSGGTVFVKAKEETPNHVASSSTSPLCTYYKKSGHT